jgi:hypothetical protein
MSVAICPIAAKSEIEEVAFEALLDDYNDSPLQARKSNRSAACSEPAATGTEVALAQALQSVSPADTDA